MERLVIIDAELYDGTIISLAQIKQVNITWYKLPSCILPRQFIPK